MAAVPTRISAARRPTKPGFLTMVDPSLVDAPPSAPGWAHEVKWDGYRLQAHLDRGRPRIFTRRGNDWTAKFPTIAAALSKLKVSDAILDGEVVAIGDGGVSDFHELRRQIGLARPRLTYQVFDLLWLDGEDLRPVQLSTRKARLKSLLDGANEAMAYVGCLEGDGRKILESACRLHLEGIVSKRLDSPYRPGRSSTWLKARCAVSETFAIVGYSLDNGRIDGIHLGRADKDGLRYAGKVENGFSGEDLDRLERELPQAVVLRPMLIETPTGKRDARWTRPEILVEVSYPNMTPDGRLRHPSFKGFRDDLLPKSRRNRNKP